MFVKVFGEKDSDSALDGKSERLSGLGTGPKAGSCSANGVPSPGPGSVDTTKVTDVELEPVSSVATRPTVKDPASADAGVPEKILLELSNRSHPGLFVRL